MSSTTSAQCFTTSTAPLSALFLAPGGDQATLVEKTLVSYGFVVTCAPTAIAAEQLCAQQRFDLAVYDQDVEGALELAGARRLSSQPRVVIGLMRAGDPIQVSGMRLHFILQKPFTAQFLAKAVAATYGPIAAERRAGFRLPVNIAASECTMLHRGELRSLAGVRLVNLSHTGLCLEASEMLGQGATVEVRFTLPQSQLKVDLVGTVIWTHISGRGGIKFNSSDPAEQKKFEDWLDSMLPKEL
jgi:PilZ domain-containing protein